MRAIRFTQLAVGFLVYRFIAYLVIAYLTTGVFFYLRQDRLLFPVPERSAKTTPRERGIDFVDLHIPVNVNDYVHAWWIPAASSSPKVMVVFHGNGYVLEDMMWDEAVSLHEIGANLLLIDYRGYGSGTQIIPSEATLNEDAAATLNYISGHRGIPVRDVFVLGRSIGSGPALFLALNNPGLGGLILESPFSSIDDAAAGFWYFRIYPLHRMLRSHFDNPKHYATGLSQYHADSRSAGASVENAPPAVVLGVDGCVLGTQVRTQRRRRIAGKTLAELPAIEAGHFRESRLGFCYDPMSEWKQRPDAGRWYDDSWLPVWEMRTRFSSAFMRSFGSQAGSAATR